MSFNTNKSDGFIRRTVTLTAEELGLENNRLDKEFKAKLISYIFSATFLVLFWWQ